LVCARLRLLTPSPAFLKLSRRGCRNARAFAYLLWCGVGWRGAGLLSERRESGLAVDDASPMSTAFPKPVEGKAVWWGRAAVVLPLSLDVDKRRDTEAAERQNENAALTSYMRTHLHPRRDSARVFATLAVFSMTLDRIRSREPQLRPTRDHDGFVGNKKSFPDSFVRTRSRNYYHFCATFTLLDT